MFELRSKQKQRVMWCSWVWVGTSRIFLFGKQEEEGLGWESKEKLFRTLNIDVGFGAADHWVRLYVPRWLRCCPERSLSGWRSREGVHVRARESTYSMHGGSNVTCRDPTCLRALCSSKGSRRRSSRKDPPRPRHRLLFPRERLFRCMRPQVGRAGSRAPLWPPHLIGCWNFKRH